MNLVESQIPPSADYSISAGTANLVGLAILIPSVLLVGFGLQVSQGAPVWQVLMQAPLAAVFGAVILGCVAHELLHAAGFIYWGRCDRSSVSFGMNWRALSPYAHCSSPMEAAAYRKAALLPGVVLGAVPLLMGFSLASVSLILFGAIMLIMATGDLLLIWLIRSVPGQTKILDHPTRVGCVLPEI